jgi:hypothetical protein
MIAIFTICLSYFIEMLSYNLGVFLEGFGGEIVNGSLLRGFYMEPMWGVFELIIGKQIIFCMDGGFSE